MNAIRSPLFGPAVLLMATAGMFTFDSTGLTWFWADKPEGALILLVCSAAMWLSVLRHIRKRSNAE